jgi:hypothetical protein
LQKGQRPFLPATLSGVRTSSPHAAQLNSIATTVLPCGFPIYAASSPKQWVPS